ncbi:MAG: sulfite exporter TauE/SafE family protein [Verrucomicrobiota bacterium]
MDTHTLIWLLPLFFLAAFVYSSVGHGGGSAYLALLALTAVNQSTIRSTALMLNIVVATAGFISYHRAQHFSWRLLVPFAIGSVPAAFVGGLKLLSPKAFSLVLGVTLLVSAARLAWASPRTITHLPARMLWWVGPPIGAGLGLVAGMVGVGGGIFLSPLLLLLGWADTKQTAAVSAAFILVNSISGLAAQSPSVDWGLVLPAAVVVLVAGIAGSRLGANRFSPVWLQRLLAFVLVTASVKLLFQAAK